MSTKKSAWQETELKNFINIVRGVSYNKQDLGKESSENFIPLLRSNNIQNDKIVYDDFVFVNKAKIKEEQYVKKNDIVISMSNSQNLVGKTGLIYKSDIMTFGTFCAVIRTINKMIDTRFLSLFFQTKEYRINISKLSKGSGNINNLKLDYLYNMKIKYPPLEEQKLIVEKIESEFQKIDNALNKLNIIKDQIKQYKQSVLKYAFDENNSFAKGSNYEPYEWEEKILDDITLKINDGTHKTPTYIKNGIPFISVKDIYDKEIHFDNCKYISEEEHNILYKMCNPEKGDVLITKSGTIGRTAVINIDTIFSLFVSVALLKPNTNIINSYYLMYSLDNYILNIDIKQNVKGGVIKNLHIEDLKMIKIKLPNIELQKNIADNIQNIFEKMDNIQNNINQNIDKLNILKQAVLKKAFEGKLI